MRCPHNHVFWRVYPFLAESFVRTEQKSFMTLARDFLSMTTWRCLGLWKCKNCWGRAGAEHSPSMHTMNFPSMSCKFRQPEALLGAAEALAGLWLQTKTFIPLQTSLVFLLSSHTPPFPFASLRNRINQVYIGGSGFFRHLAFPQHAAGKQNHCESESIMKQQETFSLWNQQGIATDVTKSQTSWWTPERHPLILWKREKQLV